MLINGRESAKAALEALTDMTEVALDTETTGLYPYHGDTFFSIIMYAGDLAYYFDFNDSSEKYLRFSDLDLFTDFFSKKRLWIGHNIKFDIAMLKTQGIKLFGPVHDTMITERLLDSTLSDKGGDFSLAVTASRYNKEKLDIVETHIKRFSLYDECLDISSGKVKKKPLYKNVPIDIMQPYGERDAIIAFQIYKLQVDLLIQKELDAVYENEMALCPVVQRMEERGVRIDPEYVKSGFMHETIQLAKARATFTAATGEEFTDSHAALGEVFSDKKPEFVYGEQTSKGVRNPSFNSDWLEKFPDDDRAKSVLLCRKHKSNADYYSGFDRVKDDKGYVHASFNQHLARTGRFSSSAPNLQNLTNSKVGGEYNVRSSIVPFKEGWWLASIDYDQIEYRIAVEYAGCPHLSAAINSGLDVHTAMAEIAGIDRDTAKAVNFAIIFGSGDRSLAETLGKTVEEVKEIKRKIFSKSPKLSQFLQKVIRTAEHRGYIKLWLGRRLEYPLLYDKFRVPYKTSYKAANGICQGNAADIIKRAMVGTDDYLTNYDTVLLMQVHDELIFSGPPDELHIVQDLVVIMSEVFPHRNVPITASAEISFTNLSEMEKYEPED